MRNSTNFLIVGLLLITNACSSFAPRKETIKGEIIISGAFALYPLVMIWAEEFQKINPGVNFDIVTGGAEQGMEDIMTKKTDIGMVSREIKPNEITHGAYPILIAKDAVFPMINAENPVVSDLLLQGISHETLVKIFISGEVKSWGQAVGKPEITDEIHVYTRTETCGAAEVWALYLGGGQKDLLGKGRLGDPGVIRALVNDPLGIGYSNQIYAYGLGDEPPSGTLILPIDFDGNNQAEPEEILDTRKKATVAVASGLYPAPPSRSLYLVTNGKPEDIVQTFIKWTLVDGQAIVNRLGYVQLTDEQLNASIQKVH